MGDEQVGEPELSLQALEEVEDLRLHRDVERRDRLVADEDLRVDGERAGDRDALALAARERRRTARRRTSAGRPTSRSSAAIRGPSVLVRVRRWRGAPRPGCGATECRGLSVEYGSWNTIWIVRRTLRAVGRRHARRNPLPRCRRSRSSPAVGVSRPTRQRPSVVLPEPDSPTRPTLSPGHNLDRYALQRVDRAAAAAGERLDEPVDADERPSGCVTGGGAAGAAESAAGAARASRSAISLRRTQAVNRPGAISASGGLPARQICLRPVAAVGESAAVRRPRRRAAPSRGWRSAAARACPPAAQTAEGPACRDGTARARRRRSSPTSSSEPA